MDYAKISEKTIGHIYSAYASLSNSPLDPLIRALVELRTSQINGCEFCCKTHTRDALKANASQQQLDELKQWQTSTSFDDRQKLALEWCEAVTHLSPESKTLKEKVVSQFNEREFVDLTTAISLMNALNRIAINLRE